VEKEIFAMLVPSDSSLSQFVETYHLLYWLILFALLGVYHFVTVAVWHWFRLLSEVNEDYYAYKIKCAENRRRYEHVAGNSVHALSRRTGGE
jgi:hypothetical protein